MKRSLVLVFVTAWLLMPTAARADHGIELAHGGGRTEVPQATCDINPSGCFSGNSAFAAQDGPGGVRGSYHFFARSETSNEVFSVRGEVDCLNVVGNTATISGEVVQQRGFTFNRFMIIATDNGNPEMGMTTDVIIEKFSFAPGGTTDPTTCVTNTTAVSVVPHTRGNVTVHDDV